jgi:hypothetical protein
MSSVNTYRRDVLKASLLRSLTHSRVRLRACIPSMPALAVKDHFTASVWASSASSCPGVGSDLSSFLRSEQSPYGVP